MRARKNLGAALGAVGVVDVHGADGAAVHPRRAQREQRVRERHRVDAAGERDEQCAAYIIIYYNL